MLCKLCMRASHLLTVSCISRDSQDKWLTRHLAATYSKNSMPVLRVDAHATVIEAALKGYVKWRGRQGELPGGVSFACCTLQPMKIY